MEMANNVTLHVCGIVEKHITRNPEYAQRKQLSCCIVELRKAFQDSLTRVEYFCVL